jgi:hypothetical protein
MQNLAAILSIFNSKLRIRQIKRAKIALIDTHPLPIRKIGGG